MQSVIEEIFYSPFANSLYLVIEDCKREVNKLYLEIDMVSLISLESNSRKFQIQAGSIICLPVPSAFDAWRIKLDEITEDAYEKFRSIPLPRLRLRNSAMWPSIDSGRAV